MSKKMTFRIPIPTSANKVYKVNRRTGRIFMSQSAVAYKEDTKHIVRRKIRENNWKIRPTTKIGVRAVIIPEYHHKFDVDNKWKLIQDVLEEAGAVHNDSQIYCISIKKTEPNKNLDYAERCIVEIRTLSDDYGSLKDV